MNRCEIELDLAPEEALKRLSEVAEECGGRFVAGASGSSGTLDLPVVFGLRRGIATGTVAATRSGSGKSRLVWTLEHSELEIHRSAVAVLVFAGVPAVLTIAWPFHPALAALLPFAAVSGLIAWWLVVSRLRTSGPEEFFQALAGKSPAAARELPVSDETS